MVDGTMVFEVSYFELMRRARVHTALETAEAARGKGVIRRVYIRICVFIFMYVYIFIHTTSVGGLARAEAPLCKNYSGRKMSRISGCETARCNLCAYIYTLYIYTRTRIYTHVHIQTGILVYPVNEGEL